MTAPASETVRISSKKIADAFATTAKLLEDFGNFIRGVAQQIERQLADPNSALSRLVEHGRVIYLSEQLGVVAHVEVLTFLSEQKAEITDGAAEIAPLLWGSVRPRLALTRDECLGDERTFEVFRDMMRGHEERLYQLTVPAAASAIERVARIAQHNEPQRLTTAAWLETRVADSLAIDARGWLALSTLTGKTFATCWSDGEADAIRFPNRHAAAHGMGSRLYSELDSLNAILLTHFVIMAASELGKTLRDDLHVGHGLLKIIQPAQAAPGSLLSSDNPQAPVRADGVGQDR